MTRARRSDDGSATAEMAVALPVLILVLAAALWALSAVAAQLRCTDVAAAAARAAARGEAPTQVVLRARGAAPRGATVTVQPTGSDVVVRVSALVRPFGGLAERLPAVRVAGSVAAATEWGPRQFGADRETPEPVGG